MDVMKLLKELQLEHEKLEERKSYKIISSLFDEGTFEQIDEFAKSNGENTNVTCGFGAVEGRPVYAFCQDIDASFGAVTKSHINKLRKTYALAEKSAAPLVCVYSSAGIKITEDEDIVYSIGELLFKNWELKDKIPIISIVSGPCYGLNALMANSSNILITTKDAKLSIDVADYNISYKSLEDNGTSHFTVDSEEDAINLSKKLLNVLPSNKNSKVPIGKIKEPKEEKGASILTAMNAISKERKYSIRSCVIEAIVDDESFMEFSELYGESLITGLAKLGGFTIGVIASNKLHNNGFTDEKACLKAAKFIKFCNSFSIPILNIIDSKGFKSLNGAVSIYSAYANAKIARINLVIGEAYGAMASLYASHFKGSDVTFAWPSASISPLPAEAMANIIFNEKLKSSNDPINERKSLIHNYKENLIGPKFAIKSGFIEGVITPLETRKKLYHYLELLLIKNN